MATSSVDKSLYEAPQGIDIPGPGADLEVEVEIETPEGVIVALDGSDPMDDEQPVEGDFDENLVLTLDDSQLAQVAAVLTQDYENDLLSRRDWEETYTEGLKLLGLQYEHRTEPWDGACGVFHPMITEAVVRFQSESISETFPAAGPVKAKIVGEVTQRKEDAAKRVAEDLNYQLTEMMPEFRPEHEKMLWNLPIAGSAFKKVYYDPMLKRQISLFVPAEDIVLPYGVSELSMAPRITHRMRKTHNEILKLQLSGFYAPIEVSTAPNVVGDEIQQAKDDESGVSPVMDDRHQLLEMHVELDLPGYEHTDEDGNVTGIGLPYVVTILQDTNQVLSIRRNWVEGDDTYTKRQHLVHYQYIPGFGSYGFGLIHLIGNSARTATALQRQLVDAGTLSNLPGGLKTAGLRVKGDDTPIAPGEFRDVDVPSGTIKENIMSLPYKEPSQTLLAMMGVLVQDAQRLASTADLKISDMSAQAPVGTTLAIIERSLKILSAVQARMHFSLKQELKLLASIVRDYMSEDYDYDAHGDARPAARLDDFSLVEIIPVSDPNASTMAQRVVQYQAVLQLAQTAPQLYDMAKLHRQMLDVLGVKNADQLVKLEDDYKPQDPISENMAVLTMKPVKAFLYQDHEAHIAVHMAAMQDPKLMQLMGQNPNANAMQAAMQAHIAEHVAFGYRALIEKQLGVALPPPGKDVAPDIEVELSRLAAQAAGKLLGKHQAEAQAAEAAQKAQDPVIQMQQQELQIKQGELELKKQKLAVDAAAAADNLAVKQEMEAVKARLAAMELASDIELRKAELAANTELSGAQLGADIAKAQADIAARQEQAGLKAGVDAAKAQQQAELAREQMDQQRQQAQPPQGSGTTQE